MYCSNCGALSKEPAAFCAQCGRALDGPPVELAMAGPRGAAGTVGGARPQVARAPASSAALVFHGAHRAGERVELSAAQCTLGRSDENTIMIDDPSVSRVHARVSRQGSEFVAEDLQSRNGTCLNDVALTAPTLLQSGDVLRLGDVELEFELALARAAVPAPTGDYLELADGQHVPLGGNDIYIGRAPTNDVVLDETTISRQHARLQQLPQGWLLTDLDSSNGSQVNGQPLSGPVFLAPGDTVTFGSFTVTFHLGGVSDRGLSRTRVLQDRNGGLIVARDERRPPVAAAPPSLAAPVVVLQNVVKSYQGTAGLLTVLKAVSLTVQPGEFVAIVGPSGCGKSTLLNLITGIDRPDSGQVTIQGQDILRLGTDPLARWRGRNLGIVFQFFQLLPTLTVTENVMMPMAFCGTYPGAQRRARALEVLRLVGMDHLADRLPSTLSGGQQQRVAIARALANDPPVLVADEPTGNLDSATSQQMFELFVNLVAGGKTLLMVTHDPVLARGARRRVEMLDGAII